MPRSSCDLIASVDGGKPWSYVGQSPEVLRDLKVSSLGARPRFALRIMVSVSRTMERHPAGHLKKLITTLDQLYILGNTKSALDGPQG